MTHKPDGYTAVAPYLIVDGAQATIDFLVAVFGAVPLRRVPRADGSLRHAEVRIDDTVVMLADPVDGWPSVASHVHVYVVDVDAVFQRAIARGAAVVQEPSTHDDGDRRGGFRDGGGTTWWAARQTMPTISGQPAPPPPAR